ncbi:MAG: ABC transporter permease [Planctomycetota bacterium]
MSSFRTVITPDVDLRTLRLGPGSMLRLLWAQRQLIVQIARRQVEARFRGSLLGRLLALVNPLLLLGVYTLVFTTLMPMPGAAADRFGFALKLFGGLLLYQVFAETVGRAPTLIVGNANYVKKGVFPLEVLPIADMLAAAMLAAGNLVVLVVALLLAGKLSVTALAFPLVLPPLFGVTAGVAWFMASLGVYVRDLASTIGVLLTMLLYLTPVFYEPADLGSWRWLADLNPLAGVFDAGRRALVHGTWPDWATLGQSWIGGALLAWLGFAWFRGTKRGFADVV